VRFALRRSGRTESPAKSLQEEVAALQRATEALRNARMSEDAHHCSVARADPANVIDIQDAPSRRRTDS
jgi:hypothetical protein